MGLFDRYRKHNVISVVTDTNETAVLEREGYHDSREHSDELPSFQSNLVRKISYSEPAHRWLHTKANPYAHKHTYVVVDHVFYHAPYPFKYIPLDTDDVLTAEEVPNMAHAHKKWDSTNMFQHFKEAVAQGNGVSASWIVRIAPDFFLVFNTSHIWEDHYYRNPITREIEEIWFRWRGAEGGFLKGSKQRNSEETIVKAKIGVNAVQYLPTPDVDTPFGRSDLLPIWMTGIYRELNAYYAVLFNKKGGINGRMLIAPDSMGTTSKKIFKKEALKGLESELIEVYYPKGLINAQIDPSKIVQWIENKGGAPTFDATNTFLATNSPLPPSFIQGPASGALGGQAPVEDSKTINRFLMSQTARIQKLVKDINNTFFGIAQQNYMVIPYFRDESLPMAANTPFGQDPKDPKDPKAKVDDKTKPAPDKALPQNTRGATIAFQRVETRNHAGAPMVIYSGNMLSSGVYQYEEYDWWSGEKKVVYEHLSPQELQKFGSDPSSVKEFYLDLEHQQHTDVSRVSAIGKAVLKDVKVVNNVAKDVTELHFKPEWDPKHSEIFLSPIYSVQLEDKGTKYQGKPILDQTNISIINCSLCSYPRSGLTGLETSAQRQTP